MHVKVRAGSLIYECIYINLIFRYMTITTKFKPYQCVYILHENRLVRCLIDEVLITARDSGDSCNPYIIKINYRLRPESGTGLPSEVIKPENEVWADGDDFLECMNKISKTIKS